MTPGGGAASVASTDSASTLRGTWSAEASALRATSCQDVSRLSAGGAERAPARKAPAPGLVTTSPSAASFASARETVTGLTRCVSTSSRLDGNFSPGE